LDNPFLANVLWAGTGSTCEALAGGSFDPIVLYDGFADRWLLGFTGSPNLCVAISQTSDPLGPWFPFTFGPPEGDYPDFPKFAVWPDAYYVSSDEVGAPGSPAYALDRAAMLAGGVRDARKLIHATLGK
jgi:hypothetical protein